jgi:predicted nucleotidyltransferase
LISQEDRKILNEFSSRIRTHFPDARIWAFGSRARGIATWESDFDICIVLEHIDNEIDRQIRDISWEVGFENDRVITTIVLDSDQFERGPMSESTLVENIVREGVAA